MHAIEKKMLCHLWFVKWSNFIYLIRRVESEVCRRISYDVSVIWSSRRTRINLTIEAYAQDSELPQSIREQVFIVVVLRFREAFSLLYWPMPSSFHIGENDT